MKTNNQKKKQIQNNVIFPKQSENFRNRHGYFSINVQTIADANLRIMNVIARWPGSAHDSTIFNNCEVRQKLERGEYGDYVIVADGGYANTAYMCTPFRANVQLNAFYFYLEILIKMFTIVSQIPNCDAKLR